MSKRTLQLFNLNKQIEQMKAEMEFLKDEIISEEILGEGKNALQDKFVTVSWVKGRASSISIDQNVLQVAEKELYEQLIKKYPKVSKELEPYYRWSFAKDK